MFRAEYGLSAREIFRLTWREFRVMFNHAFTRDTKADEKFDWNAALDRSVGREPASNRITMSIDEFMKGQSG